MTFSFSEISYALLSCTISLIVSCLETLEKAWNFLAYMAFTAAENVWLDSPDTSSESISFAPTTDDEIPSILLTSDSPSGAVAPEWSGVCVDCGQEHSPQRLVICVDGTWMLPDGAIGICHEL
jgi:hypothetical protein